MPDPHPLPKAEEAMLAARCMGFGKQLYFRVFEKVSFANTLCGVALIKFYQRKCALSRKNE